MTHNELLAELDSQVEISKAVGCDCKSCDNTKALRAVVELHKEIPSRGANYPAHFPSAPDCAECSLNYPCPTIQAITNRLGE